MKRLPSVTLIETLLSVVVMVMITFTGTMIVRLLHQLPRQESQLRAALAMQQISEATPPLKIARVTSTSCEFTCDGHQRLLSVSRGRLQLAGDHGGHIILLTGVDQLACTRRRYGVTVTLTCKEWRGTYDLVDAP